ncbi:Crp/Fnr family transcriptional regulator [Methylobacterium terricola]|uniref:Crp/Fnr family transcriptional regulator n=1 Tax=Methylobacterium terricola TaxID=2583531 RepID=A0A5C4L594_9HYPH|nr:Crp/Fnr family transcriptional regulator [Methylobacterium terricola]TNC05413.1 Crp/Fnr family transcriptional regulator [Methylobacterium terricola]
MENPLVAKLQQFARLSCESKAALHTHTNGRVCHYGAHEDIISEGDRPYVIRLILTGWAYRYKQLNDGRRQILALSLPGDLCDHNVFVLREMDHTLSSLTPVTLAEITPAAFHALTLAHPCIAQALWWETLVNVATQREWTTNMGCRYAAERLAHLFCEIFYRLRGVGLTEEASCPMPLTQTDLADATGMTTVHVNRSLQELRAERLITIKQRRLTIPDLAALERRALFNPSYLHLYHIGQRRDTKGD